MPIQSMFFNYVAISGNLNLLWISWFIFIL